MDLEPVVPVYPNGSLADSPGRAKQFKVDQGAFPALLPPPQPAFVDTFQQIINGLPEQIALVDENWVILVVNDAWTRAAELYGYHELLPGRNYFEFCVDKANEGHASARPAADGIREIESGATKSFRYVYHGNDRWEGHAFQLCVNRLEVGGQTFATITRYDVTELVHLRQMREDFSHSVIEGQAEERRRMAREVHDSTMQLLAGVSLSLGLLKHSSGSKATGPIVEEMEQLLGEAQRELRTIAYLAHAPQVSELGLAKALRQLAGGFGRRTGLNIVLNVDDDLRLSPAAEVATYRMVQEALSNVHRHAHATDVAVGLFQRRSFLHVAVADNGVGMLPHVRRGVGLSSMRARITELGGRLSIRSTNPGTMLIASVPAQGELRTAGDLVLPGSVAVATSSRGFAVGSQSCPYGHSGCVPAHVIAKEEWLPGPDSNRRPFD